MVERYFGGPLVIILNRIKIYQLKIFIKNIKSLFCSKRREKFILQIVELLMIIRILGFDKNKNQIRKS